MNIHRMLLAAGMLFAFVGTGFAQGSEGSGMSIEEMVTNAKDKVREMEKKLAATTKQLEAAAESGNDLAIAELNEKLDIIQGLVRLSEQNLINLQNAAASGSTQSVEHEYMKISIAAEKVGQIEFPEIEAPSGAPSMPDEDESDIEDESDPSTEEPEIGGPEPELDGGLDPVTPPPPPDTFQEDTAEENNLSPSAPPL